MFIDFSKISMSKLSIYPTLVAELPVFSVPDQDQFGPSPSPSPATTGRAGGTSLIGASAPLSQFSLSSAGCFSSPTWVDSAHTIGQYQWSTL